MRSILLLEDYSLRGPPRAFNPRAPHLKPGGISISDDAIVIDQSGAALRSSVELERPLSASFPLTHVQAKPSVIGFETPQRLHAANADGVALCSTGYRAVRCRRIIRTPYGRRVLSSSSADDPTEQVRPDLTMLCATRPRSRCFHLVCKSCSNEKEKNRAKTTVWKSGRPRW